ncbi:hypothetical protein [Mucilaginibacter sp. L196]|uniref:hypothetical protein n=1 Tax=Mucilaginibacter sp. L196 TaxID=1641870 RepID=UPI00131C8F8B|nr:hypothetical protein [Mucilaginibacter sp. L196]
MKPLNYSILFILSLFVAACSNPPGNPLNQEASFPPSFDLTKMGLKVITSSINKKQATMNTLYGNAAALKDATDSTQHQPGETFALVTWKQKADGHWFGANIPGDLQSVTMLKTSGQSGAITLNCQKYTGKNLTMSADTVGNSAITKFILSERASVMP